MRCCGCGKPPDDPRFKMCSACRERRRRLNRTPKGRAAKRAYRKRPDVKAKASAAAKARYAANKDKETADRKRRESERLAAGLCVKCGRFPLDKPGVKTCMDCRQDKADYHARPEVKKRRKAYMKEYEQRPRTKAYRKASLPARKEYSTRYRQTDGYFEMLARAAERERKSKT